MPKSLILAAAAALSVLILVPLTGGAAGRPAVDNKDDKLPLNYLPGNCLLMTSVQVKDLLASETWKEIVKELPEAVKYLQEDMEAEFGIARGNMVQLVVGVSPEDPKARWERRPGPVHIVRVDKATSADDIQAMRKKQRPGKWHPTEYREVRIGKLTMHEGNSFFGREKFDGSGNSFCIVADKIVVYGKAFDLKPILERAKPELSAEMQKALAGTDLGRTVAIATAIKADAQGNPPTRLLPPLPGLVQSILYTSSSVSIGPTIKMSQTIVCKDAKAAEAMQKLAESAVAMAKQMPLPKEAAAMLDGIQVKRAGSQVTGSLEIKSSEAIKIVKEMEKAVKAQRAASRW